jgi:hypothetical protein
MANLKQMWQSGATYEELHRVDSPHSKCECDHCEMMREFEDWDQWAWEQGAGDGVNLWELKEPRDANPA